MLEAVLEILAEAAAPMRFVDVHGAVQAARDTPVPPGRPSRTALPRMRDKAGGSFGLPVGRIGWLSGVPTTRCIR